MDYMQKKQESWKSGGRNGKCRRSSCQCEERQQNVNQIKKEKLNACENGMLHKPSGPPRTNVELIPSSVKQREMQKGKIRGNMETN